MHVSYTGEKRDVKYLLELSFVYGLMLDNQDFDVS
jgi:hypothetical protein